MLKRFFGTIVPGDGAAAGNLVKQIPLIVNQFPEILGAYAGTINVQLDSQDFRIGSPDFKTTPIDWREPKPPGAGNPGPEVFYFTRICIQMEGPNAPRHCAWIYGPQQSEHRDAPGYIEVVAPAHLDGFNKDARCTIFIEETKLLAS